MTDSMSSLDAAREALHRADATVTRLLGRPRGPDRDSALARALTDRARAWRAVAQFSFDDVVAGDLLCRAAQHAASYDDLMARRQHITGDDADPGPPATSTPASPTHPRANPSSERSEHDAHAYGSIS